MSQPSSMTCAEVFKLLEDYVDRELDPRELQEVHAHLDLCAVCAREHRFEQKVLDEIRAKVRRIAIPPTLVARISAQIAAARREHS